MTSKDDAYQSLRSAVAALGYPDELAEVLANELRGPDSMRRMAAYLRAARPQSMEQIADEMLAIVEQREAWVRKKVSEHAQSSFNEFLNRAPETDV